MSAGLESTAKNSASDAPGRRPAPVFVAALACALLTALLVSPPSPPLSPVSAGSVADDAPRPRRVSTSPDEDTTRASSRQTRPAAAESGTAIPLTRAAARRRVEKISPVPWLARFGPVSLERRE